MADDDPLCQCGHPRSRHTGKRWVQGNDLRARQDREEGCAAEGSAPDGGWDFCGCTYFHQRRREVEPASWLA